MELTFIEEIEKILTSHHNVQLRFMRKNREVCLIWNHDCIQNRYLLEKVESKEMKSRFMYWKWFMKGLQVRIQQSSLLYEENCGY